MQMHEKIERSRANARIAFDAYMETGWADPTDELTSIGDLITDLLHLADSLPQDADADWPPLLLDRANHQYVHEANPEHAHEEV